MLDNPYKPALVWIRAHPGTGSATGLAKLILSLWNEEAAFSFRECARSFDPELDEIALRMIEHFTRHGEDDLLRAAGDEIYDSRRDLWDLGYAGTEAKRATVKEWERTREERDRKEHPEWFGD
jgi:hypothetical protein